MIATICLSIGFLSIGLSQDSIKVGDFSKDLDDWTFYNGKEFPGAEGNLWYENTNNEGSAVLEGNFSNGGVYVGMTKNLKTPLALKGLKIKLKTEDLRAVIFRAIDSEGQVFQQRLELGNDAADGCLITVSSFTGGKNFNYWGGKKDGQWRGTVKAFALNLDYANLIEQENKKGRLIIESIEGIPLQ